MLVETLGTQWEAERPGIFVKGWPCCYCSHRAVGGLLQLIAAERFGADDVEEVAIGFAPGSDRALIKSDPQSSEEHTSELQSLMRITYAVFCLYTNNGLTAT